MPVLLLPFLSTLLAAPVSLLPDGLLASGQGLSGQLEVGPARVAGHRSPLSSLAARGAFAYVPLCQSSAYLDVESTQPADSMVLTRSRLGLSFHIFQPDTGTLSSFMTPTVTWWTQTFHLDTGSHAIEVDHSGLEMTLGLGVGRLGGRNLQAATGVSAGFRTALLGPQKARPEALLRWESALGWSLQDILDRRKAFSQGLGVTLRLPIQWTPYPLDPAQGTGRPFALPRWQIGLRLGVTALL